MVRQVQVKQVKSSKFKLSNLNQASQVKLDRDTAPRKRPSPSLSGKRGGRGHWSDQPVAYCPVRPPELTPLFTTHLFSHSSARTFIFPFSPHFSHSLLSYSKSWLDRRNLLYLYWFSYYTLIHSLFLQILLMRSRRDLPCSFSVPNSLRLLLPSSLHIMLLNSHPCYHSPSLLTPTRPPFRCRLLRIVFRFFGYCPRAGLFAATTLSRFWNCVATYAWLGLALAVSCAFYAVFASPSQDKLSGLWGGCSFTFHYCFTTFAYEKYLLEGLPRT